MLHELLLAASGHPSHLTHNVEDKTRKQLRSPLSSAEQALIDQVACLGSLEEEVRRGATDIFSGHSSIICRAVGSSILTTHLISYQNHVLRVEHFILDEDSSLVGAYRMVPLSGVSTALNSWRRKLEWLVDLLTFMHTEKLSSSKTSQSCRTGSQTIDWLRSSSHTGFPDLENLIVDLTRVAESSWLRQVSTWLLYGHLPPFDQQEDFFIQQVKRGVHNQPIKQYTIRKDLCPGFLTESTARSILFVGRSLNYIHEQHKSAGLKHGYLTNQDVAVKSIHGKHLNYISSINYPIAASDLNMAVNSIRLSLAQTSLRKLLPIAKILHFLDTIRELLLLKRVEFGMGLITAADEYLSARIGSIDKPRIVEAQQYQGIMIKEGELRNVLRRAVTLSSPPSSRDLHNDNYLDLLQLSIKKPGSSLQESSLGGSDILDRLPCLFDDNLFGTPTHLTIRLEPCIGLIFTSIDMAIVSTINSYLLGIRRSHMRLLSLWKLNTLRRLYPRRNPGTDKKNGGQLARLRRMWATLGLAASFLAELDSYLQGEVIDQSWGSFRTWLMYDVSERTQSNSQDAESELSIYRDPETILIAHRRYLESLAQQIFLSDANFTTALRQLNSHIDIACSLLKQLDPISKTLTEEQLLSPDQSVPRLSKEEDDLLIELLGLEKIIAQDLKDIFSGLQKLDTTLGEMSASTVDVNEMASTGFSPWRNSGINSLLVKLDLEGRK